MSGPLSPAELAVAKTKLFYCVQRENFVQEIADLKKGKSPSKGSPLCSLDPFVDDEGLLRIKGRLENADLSFESKHPVIIPSGHVAKLLVQFQHIFLKHAGVGTIVSTLRGSYRILGVRRIAKTVCRMCVKCKRGWWERLIRSVKSALRKTIGVKCLSKIELETTIQEIEACVNSRPLTYVGDEPDVSNPLTPSQFLIGRNAGLQLEVNDQPSCITGKDLIIRESIRQQQLDKFWKLWSNDYLRNLPPVVKGFVQKCNVKKGAIVLVREDYVPRLKWPLGVVTEVFPGNDNIIRSVMVKTDKGVFNRPVQKLHDLEMYSDLYEDSDEDLRESISGEIVKSSVPGNNENSASEPCEESCLNPTSFSQRGRAIKHPNKLDL
nr:uncharacterized protein LOC113815479 [Penaeus vannamei]